MKPGKDSFFQGDVFVRRIKGLPDTAASKGTADAIRVSESETGHVHRVVRRSASSCEEYTDTANPRVSYVKMRQTADSARKQAEAITSGIDALIAETAAMRLEHAKADGHEAYALASSEEEEVFEFRRQREMRPNGLIQAVQD
jgi:hypothetical protein